MKVVIVGAGILSLSAAGVPFERLTPAEAVRRFPTILPDGIEQAAHVPSSGPLRAGEIVAALATWISGRTAP